MTFHQLDPLAAAEVAQDQANLPTPGTIKLLLPALRNKDRMILALPPYMGWALIFVHNILPEE